MSALNVTSHSMLFFKKQSWGPTVMSGMAHSMYVYMYHTIHRQILHVLKSIVHLGTPMSVYEVYVTALVRRHLRHAYTTLHTCQPILQ